MKQTCSSLVLLFAFLGLAFGSISVIDDFSIAQQTLTVAGDSSAVNASIITSSAILGGVRKMQLTGQGNGGATGAQSTCYVSQGLFVVSNDVNAAAQGSVVYDGTSTGSASQINTANGLGGGYNLQTIGGAFLISATYDNTDNFTLTVYSVGGGMSSFVQQITGTQDITVRQNFTISFSQFSGNVDFSRVTAVVLHSDYARVVDAYFDFFAVTNPDITGTVFFDTNCNGFQDIGESGASGVTVIATPTSSGPNSCPSGTATMTTTTNSTGQYDFMNTAVCQYTITVPGTTNCAGSTPSETVLGTPEGAALNIPLKNLPPVTGTVYYDSNCDGTLDNSEQGVPGVSVTATPSSSCPSGTQSQTSVTNSNGVYSFSGLAACQYTFSATGTTSCSGSSPSSVTQNTNQATTINIPTQAKPPITGTVYNDVNCNGQQDAGEAGVSGVSVTATPNFSGPDSCPANTPSQTTPTNANGQFSFTNTLSCAYTVTVAGSTSCNGGTPTTSTNGQSQSSIPISIPVKPKNTLSGTVFYDSNCDNTFQSNSEQGVPGVTVIAAPNFSGSNACPSGSQQLSTITNANGQYSFTNIPSCSYTVTAQGQTMCSGSTSQATTNGQTVSGSNVITVNLPVKSAPVLTAPGPVTISCTQSRSPSTTGNATVSSTGTVMGTLTYTDSPVSYPNGVCGNGQFTRTFSFNGQTATQVITISAPTSGPTFTSVPPSANVACGQSSSPSVTGNPVVVDTCGLPVTVTYADVAGATSCSQSCISSTTILRTFTANDGCFSTTATQTLTVCGGTGAQQTPIVISGASASSTPIPFNNVNICPSYTPYPCPSVANIVCPGGAVSGSSTITFSAVLLVVAALAAF